MNIEPLVLEGIHVRLEPLSLEHVDRLCDGGLDPDLWQWTPTIVRTPQDMLRYVKLALQMQRDGTAVRNRRTLIGKGHRQHSIWKYRKRLSPRRNWLDLDSTLLTADSNQHGNKVLDVEACIRGSRLHES
jgi:hypothetical protein